MHLFLTHEYKISDGSNFIQITENLCSSVNFHLNPKKDSLGFVSLLLIELCSIYQSGLLGVHFKGRLNKKPRVAGSISYMVH